MEMAIFLPLLLLICFGSTSPLQSDNEVIPPGKQSKSQGGEQANASGQQQACTPDIHALLREMSASLAEQRVEIRYLQRHNEVQAAQLKELELQKVKVEQQLQVQAAQLKELELQKVNMEQQLQVQAAQLKELEVNVEQQLQAQTAELIAVKARTNVTENHVEALRREGEVKQVAFSASLLASGSGTIGPFNTNTPLVFRYVVTNIGNAYSPNTGFFIAPVRGAYHFEFYIGAHGHSSYPSAAVLVKNAEHVFIAYEHQPSGYGSSAQGATLLLEVGDVVFLRLWINTIIYDSENHHSTFSGHLLFPM